MRFIKDAGVFLLMAAMVFTVVYMMVYAWDQEYEYQQQKEKEYYEQVYRG
jgi:large-conductance mechanosensitive channel